MTKPITALSEKIEDAAMVLRHSGHYDLAQQLTSQWEAFSAELDGYTVPRPGAAATTQRSAGRGWIVEGMGLS